jgi:hypothetical protein
MVVTVETVFVSHSEKPLKVATPAPVVQSKYEGVTPWVVILDTMIERTCLNDVLHIKRGVRDAFIESSSWTKLPTSELLFDCNGADLANRSADQFAHATYDLFRNRDPFALRVVERLDPVTPPIVS